MRRGTHAAGDGSFNRSAGAAAGRGVVLLVAAVLLGIVLLNRVDTSGPSSDNKSVAAGNTTTTAPAPTTTTLPVRDPKDVKVLAVNGTKVVGAGGRVKDRIAAGGYNVLAPDQATKDTNQATTVVWFTADYQREAVVLAHLLGLPDTTVQALKDPALSPHASTANILVEVGTDLANQPASTTTTTAAHTTTTAAHTTTTAAKATTTTAKH